MNARTKPLLAAVLLVSAVQVWSVLGWADGDVAEGPAPAAPAETPAAEAEARVLGSGRDASGVHAFFVRGPDGKPSAWIGKPGELRALDIINVERGKDSFIVDTLEEGILIFDVREGTVTLPGEIGFVQRRPTTVFGERPDPRVVAEMQREVRAHHLAARASAPAEASLIASLASLVTGAAPTVADGSKSMVVPGTAARAAQLDRPAASPRWMSRRAVRRGQPGATYRAGPRVLRARR